MDPTVQSTRLAAGNAFGVRWGQPSQAPRAGDTAARTERVIDVKVRRVDPDAPAPKPPVREATNVFLPVTTYAPPQHPGQAVRLVQFSDHLGQNLDSWA